MSENPLGISGMMNPCYVYFVRFSDCIKKESFQKLFCMDEWEDFQECKTQKRHKSFKVWYAFESRRTKILSLPIFDDKTDSFVSGALPASCDSFFNDNDKMKEFFTIKKNAGVHHTEEVAHSH